MLNIFGEKFRVCSGISINTEFADKLGQMVMDEIKKVFSYLLIIHIQKYLILLELAKNI